jgi:hypothetical protein
MQHPSKALWRKWIAIGLVALFLLSSFGWILPRTRADSETPSSYLPAVMQHLANYTEIPTSNATATATITSTATTTATPTATATATGTPLASCSNRYPIILASSLLDLNDFNPPSDPAELPYFGLYSDATYTNKSQRRIYLTGGFSDGFSFVRWRADTAPDSVTALVASLSGAGNIAQGFDEAPWPSSLGAMPPGYPLRPGYLHSSDSDWIYGSNASINNDVLTALQYHFDNKTLMTLPINDAINGAGSNFTYHVQRLGDFLLRGYGNQPGKGRYLDLVSIGYSTAPQCE